MPSKPPRINITEIKIEKEADVPPGNGLLKPSRFARVRLKIELPRVEPEDDVMTLVRIGESWRALPKAAAKLLP